jgi:hypothetical protein
MSMHDISGRISARALFTGRGRAEVAREIAKEDRQAGLHRRLRAASHPLASHHVHDDPRRTLLDMVFGVIDRLFGADSKPYPRERRPLRGAASTAATEPERARPPLPRRIGDAFTPEPPPPAPTAKPPMIRAEGSNAVLLSDGEFTPGVRSVPTENWRLSIETNARDYEAKRGKPKSSFYIG